MKRNYLLNDSIISPLGFGTQANLNSLLAGESGLKLHQNSRLFPDGYYAGLIPDQLIDNHFERIGKSSNYTRLEKMLILSINDVIEQVKGFDFENTGLVLATTKGNIDELNRQNFSKERVYLWKLGEVIADFFGFKKEPVIVSNACISGGLAIKVANDLINSGKFQQAIVAAGDLVSEFVLSGFQSFQAISPEPCRPFSNDRRGISLGEAAAATLVGPSLQEVTKIAYVDAVTANDANHISGPSRTGEGLFLSVQRLLDLNNILTTDIDFLSAHGTATEYNDEMESVAFSRVGLQDIPLNSFKGYYGHSLGASALVESILTKHSMLNDELIASGNFTGLGTSRKLNIIERNESKKIKKALKTASGFGGCNLAMLFEKEEYEQ